jgi:YjbE family integral membrane protein
MSEFLNGMGVNLQPQFWISVLEIIWINILLSGDNAVVIALACRTLPAKQRMAGMVFGTAMALVLRLIFASVVSTLMVLPYTKIVGGLALLWIGAKLLAPPGGSGEGTAPSDSVWRAVKLIALADVVMSLDNVIAVAAAAGGNVALLIFGLGISIPAIVAGANVVMAMLTYFPLTIWAGAALLGWIAGDVIASDTVLVDYTASLGPGIHEKTKIALAVVGVATVLGAELIRRARVARTAARQRV